jgi:hypothetical protein
MGDTEELPMADFVNGTTTNEGDSLEQTHSFTTGKSLTGPVSNDAGPFLTSKCLCASGSCNFGYIGSHDDCMRWAKTQGNQFIPAGEYTVTYFPSGTFSRGGCTVCGNIDPCLA